MKNILVTVLFTDEQKTLLQELVPEWPIHFSSVKSVTAEMVGKAEIILGNIPLPLISAVQSLQWIQLHSAGAIPFAKTLDHKIALTCGTGAFGASVAEHLLAIILAAMKNLPEYAEEQARSNWIDFLPQRMMAGSTVLVVGTGDIGGSFARMVQAMGAVVLGCKRAPSSAVAGFDEIYTIDQLDLILPKADIVALAIPGTDASHHLIDKKRLLLMKQDAIIANVGRGNAIDTEALCDVMAEGHLAAATLDVTEQEPLPSDSRLWKTPRILITPHAGGGLLTSHAIEQVFRICYENLRRFRDGETLMNNVDRETGYKESTVH